MYKKKALRFITFFLIQSGIYFSLDLKNMYENFTIKVCLKFGFAKR